MQTSTILDASLPCIVAEQLRRVKLTARDVFMMSSFAKGSNLDDENADRADEQQMHHAVLVKENSQNKPNYEKYCRGKPKFRACLRLYDNLQFVHWYNKTSF